MEILGLFSPGLYLPLHPMYLLFLYGYAVGERVPNGPSRYEEHLHFVFCSSLSDMGHGRYDLKYGPSP